MEARVDTIPDSSLGVTTRSNKQIAAWSKYVKTLASHAFNPGANPGAATNSYSELEITRSCEVRESGA